ncbi:MAG: pyridinium-3,5-biscarboxylic acid mononucleotide synthase [Candidatus Binatota bacterium]|nr:pyridinium-3,5-biscarboxylic acid mononucleotide synthase [Candidatus Binatota bacterium]
MDVQRLKSLLEAVRQGEVTVEGAVERLRRLPFEDLGFAKVDHHRGLRQGTPEVVFAPGKTRAQIVAIAGRLAAAGEAVVITRLAAADAVAIRRRIRGLRYSDAGRVAWLSRRRREPPLGRLLVVSAGTSDIPVAEEAAITAECAGCAVDRLFDVGVSGIHRLLENHEQLDRAHVIVVVAGMEGALPSVVGGLVSQPVIAVPTSIGYGASFGGLAALLAMLNTCAAGVTVVNIDNGFGAAMAAVRLLHQLGRAG